MKLSESFGQSLIRLPLKKSAHITHGNALTIDWQDVIAPSKLSYMLGNPPFVGARKKNEKKSDETAAVFAGSKGASNLDYVAAWYLLAAQYIQGTHIKVAFVSTNSITQGEQVAALWQPMLSHYGIHIHFAHRTFKWTIDEKKAKGMKIANVHCVIIGFSAHKAEEKFLFEYETPVSDPHRIQVKNINPYLAEAQNVLIATKSTPLCNVPPIVFGNMPNDGGHLILSDEEKTELLHKEPAAKKFIKPLVSAHEYINGLNRWCLWLHNAEPAELKSLPMVMQRVDNVKRYRQASTREATKKLAATPYLFGEIRQPETSYVLIPRVSSEKRTYVPMGFFSAESIVGDTCLCIPNATLYHFGVLTSLMHMDWMRHVCGRLKSDYRYSNTLVYNNFPWPAAPKPEQVRAIEDRAQAVLDARAQFPNSTLADLYDPLTMPPALLKAHQALDKAVDAAYRKKPFESERERIEYLFTEYQRLTAPLIGAIKPKPRKKRDIT